MRVKIEHGTVAETKRANRRDYLLSVTIVEMFG